MKSLRLVTVFLGFWLLFGIVTFGDGLCCSDFISGVLLIVLGALSYKKPRVAWLSCFVGIWLQFAPLVFWAKSPYAYINDTMVGFLVVAFAILLPKTPGGENETGPTIPRGWTYNPSSWMQRIPVIVLATACWFMSRYLAAFQLGYISSVWDPAFHNGTLHVITSKISKSLPVSDAGLGALAYSLEALMGCKGGARRWFTMPWIVVGFGVLVIPVGFVSVLLIILQPVAVGSWCFLCLLTAACMLLMITLTIDEVAAVLQYLKQARKAGKPLWSTFWKGGELVLQRNEKKEPFTLRGMFYGVKPTWALLLTTALGVWLMFSPAVLGTVQSAADSTHIAGALLIVFSVISMAIVVRKLKFILIPLGLWLIVAPWILNGATTASLWNDVVLGLATLLLLLI